MPAPHRRPHPRDVASTPSGRGATRPPRSTTSPAAWACASRRSSTSSRRRRRCSTACLDAAAAELTAELEPHPGRRARRVAAACEALIRKAFRLAARRPALLGLLREADRLGPPASTRLVERPRPRSSPGPSVGSTTRWRPAASAATTPRRACWRPTRCSPAWPPRSRRSGPSGWRPTLRGARAPAQRAAAVRAGCRDALALERLTVSASVSKLRRRRSWRSRARRTSSSTSSA